MFWFGKGKNSSDKNFSKAGLKVFFCMSRLDHLFHIFIKIRLLAAYLCGNSGLALFSPHGVISRSVS